MKKVLIVYATAGEGHKRAAFSIKGAFDEMGAKDYEVQIVDSLDYTNAFFKWFYPRSYMFMVTYLPTLWGFFYYLLDIKRLYPFVKFTRRIVNKNHAKCFEEFLCGLQPDVIVSTHFLTNEVVSGLKERGLLNSKLITCVTDFRMHSFWFAKETDFFCVAFKETRDDLVKKWGFLEDKIKILGIPIHPKFCRQKNKDEICQRLNISKERFSVLVTGGGFGVGPIVGIVRSLVKTGLPMQILVVCGHNNRLKEQLDQLSAISAVGGSVSGGSHQLSAIKTFGFIDYMDELMEVSQIGITKAGGLITSESITKGLPLIIIAPIPGQESRNCRLLLSNKAAFRINNPAQVPKVIKQIFCDQAVLKQVRENIMRIKKDDPSTNIVKFVVSML